MDSNKDLETAKQAEDLKKKIEAGLSEGTEEESTELSDVDLEAVAGASVACTGGQC